MNIESILEYNFLLHNICWVAYSGGLDSSILLHTLAQLRQEKTFTLRAVHIHHGLNPKADAWQQHCAFVCRDLDVELAVYRLNLSSSQDNNVEARARELRYQFFSSLLESDDCLLTGHHQDDQAETMLLQLLRGAGPKGMSAMPAKSRLGKGLLLRPFLNISRDELLAYAKAHQLKWIEDDSNQNTRFSRNFIRQEVMPLLKTRWPNAIETITRSAKHCAETEALLSDYLTPLLQSCLSSHGLSVCSLKCLTFVQQKHVVRYWLSRQNIPLPNEVKLEDSLRVFLTAAEDKNPMVEWSGVVLRRYQNELIVSSALKPHNAEQIFVWDITLPLRIESLNMVLQATLTSEAGVKILPHQACEIRFRCHNERIYLANRKGGRTLKKCFQEWRVPAWQRDRVPLLYVDGKLAAIIGYAICEGFAVKPSEVGYKIQSD